MEPTSWADSVAHTAGRGRRPVRRVHVDDTLSWVVVAPEQELVSVCVPSAAALAALGSALDADEAAASSSPWDAVVVDAAARVVAHLLRDLPELPYIGEPFGGEEGTD